MDLELLFLIQYYSFALFFYMIFKYSPLDLTISKNGKPIDNPYFKKIFTICVCVAWIVAIPFILMQTIQNKKIGKK